MSPTPAGGDYTPPVTRGLTSPPQVSPPPRQDIQPAAEPQQRDFKATDGPPREVRAVETGPRGVEKKANDRVDLRRGDPRRDNRMGDEDKKLRGDRKARRDDKKEAKAKKKAEQNQDAKKSKSKAKTKKAARRALLQRRGVAQQQRPGAAQKSQSGGDNASDVRREYEAKLKELTGQVFAARGMSAPGGAGASGGGTAGLSIGGAASSASLGGGSSPTLGGVASNPTRSPSVASSNPLINNPLSGGSLSNPGGRSPLAGGPGESQSKRAVQQQPLTANKKQEISSKQQQLAQLYSKIAEEGVEIGSQVERNATMALEGSQHTVSKKITVAKSNASARGQGMGGGPGGIPGQQGRQNPLGQLTGNPIQQQQMQPRQPLPQQQKQDELTMEDQQQQFAQFYESGGSDIA